MGQFVLTPEVLAKVLYLVTQEGTVSAACKHLGVNPTAIYNYTNINPDFKAKLAYAKEIGMEALEDELHRRAFRGDVVMTKDGPTRKFSDQLGMFLMKGAKPEKYRERVSQEVNSQGTVQIHVVTGIGGENPDALPPPESTMKPAVSLEDIEGEALPVDGSDLV